PAWAPERGNRTPTLNGPPCARAELNDVPVAVSNPAAPAPAAKPRRGRAAELVVIRIILSSPEAQRSCARFSLLVSFRTQWAMTARSGRASGPHSVRARWQEPRRPGAISPSRRASMATAIARGGPHGRRTCPRRAAGGLSRGYAQPAAVSQRVQRSDASSAQARAGRGRGGWRPPPAGAYGWRARPPR